MCISVSSQLQQFSRGLGICLLILLAGTLSAQELDMDLFESMKPRNIGPAGMSGRVTSIDVVLDDPQTMFVGTASGGLWKSESGGISWEPIFDDQKVASIGAVAVCQQNPDLVWVGTGEGNPRNSQSSGAGIYKSLDGGKHWTCMGLEQTRNIHRVIIHPQNPNIVYAGAIGSAWGDHPERGVYKTTDGGETWEQILFVNDRTGVADMVIDPSNPQKLIVAMWEYRRWPWFFNSGGPGSGLYVTHDGGENWQERTSEEGLPKGELGRMGLAIAPGNPKVVYALIESKKNAIYRSEDGGFKWTKVNDNSDFGGRPFYYADIFVDPQNENRIYSIHSMVSMSEDGGKSFEILIPYSGVHPDHHAWWIHPQDPHFLIDGNDGGMAISRDRGKTWRFIENLPLAQYYHIRVDNEQPYNVYGGMQDNGSWRGPAYVWRSGGIRNAYFEELYFGDGFDVAPDPDASDRFGYAMSQQGFLGRYDLKTRSAQLIRPVHPEGTPLRYNWNAGLALDPFDPATIYYGSQFVHKSTDRGQSWEIISPDLTSNDPERQKQLESGGLTYDVTGAENFTTIVAIAPSSLDRQLIWVGTDDGQVQLTKDGGETWENIASRLPGMPEGSWIPQVHASTYSPGTAVVVANNYRRDDWTPMLYQTTDYGQTWTRMVDEENVWGYCLSFVQDPVEPNLMFLGTEFGLYVSVDGGNDWTQWKQGYPTVSTMDLQIHPREHDLVIGTFGRSAWVLDDIRPLRTLASEGTDVLKKQLHVFDPPVAVLAEIGEAAGTRFAADAIYAGNNRPFGAMITYSVKKEEKSANSDSSKTKASPNKVKVEIVDSEQKVIRTLHHTPRPGVNRMYWGLDHTGVRFPGSPKPAEDAEEPGGAWVLPGTYTVRMHFGSATDSTQLTVEADPRSAASFEDRKGIWERSMAHQKLMAYVTEAMDRLNEAQETLGLLEKQLPKEDSSLVQQTQALKDTIQAQMEKVRGKRGLQGIVRSPDILNARMGQVSYYLGASNQQHSPNADHLMRLVAEEVEAYVAEVNQFFEGQWKPYREAVEEANVSPFKDYEPISVE